MNKCKLVEKSLYKLIKIVIGMHILCSQNCVVGSNYGSMGEYSGDSMTFKKEMVLTKAPPVTLLGDPSVTLVIPARKVCHKGSFDSGYNSCTYIDKKDEAVPIYEVCLQLLRKAIVCIQIT